MNTATEATRSGMIKTLKENICRVDFVKANGENRVMNCTLNFSNIPEEAHPKNDSVDTWPEGLIKVYDIQANGWRSFKVDSVLFFTPLDV